MDQMTVMQNFSVKIKLIHSEKAKKVEKDLPLFFVYSKRLKLGGAFFCKVFGILRKLEL